MLHVKTPLLANQALSVPLPDIHLTDLGSGSDGITPAELTDKIVKSLMKEVVPAATKLVTGVGKDVEKQGENAVKGATKGLKNIFGH